MDLTHRFRDCACPGTPHPDGDTVTYPERLTFDQNVMAVSAIFEGDGGPHANKAFRVYLHSPLAWNVVDADGKPVPLDVDSLEFADQYEIADYGDTLYAGTVLAPLLRRTAALSKSGPTPAGSRRRRTA